jgi:hypothetical protein
MTAETATEATASLNGSAPAPEGDSGACQDCVTSGEKLLAGLAIAFALFIAAMGIDMLTGGKLTGYVREQVAPGE